jgi:protoheme IX farnesyltransferase
VAPPPSALLAYWELTKPRVVWLILMSTAVGFYMGVRGGIDYLLLANTLIGTALLAGGTGALNQWLERDADAKMRRTADRPLPAGRLRPVQACRFGIAISLLGLVWLIWGANLLCALVGFLTLASYLAAYTPLKSRTPLATFIGAFPGAAPPLMGWVAARESLSLEGWVLFAILFLWQFPHFYAIGWMYRSDYIRAGIRMLPAIDPDGAATGRQIVAYAAVLIPVGLAPAILGMAGNVYVIGSLLLGLGYLYSGILAARRKSGLQARRLLLASVTYLPLLYLFLEADMLRCQPIPANLQSFVVI